MKSSKHRSSGDASSETTQTASIAPPSLETQTAGNSAAIEQMGSTDAAAQETSVLDAVASGGSMMDRLRDKVGGALADAITKHLSEEELAGYVQPAIDDLMTKIRAGAEGGDHGLTESQLQAALADLDAKLNAAAAQLLARLDVDGFLSDLALDYPLSFGTAVLASVVAWALTTNPDLPSVSKDKDLGNGHSVAATLDLGQLLDLSVQHVEVTYAYAGEKTDVNLRAFGGENDGGYGIEGGITHDGERTDAALSGRYFSDGTGHIEGSLAHDGKKTDAALSGRYATDGIGHVEGSLTHDGKKTDAALSGRYATDGTWKADGSLSRDGTRTDASLKASAQGGPEGTNWQAEGRLDHDGKKTDGYLEAKAAEQNGVRSGHVAGRAEQVDGEKTRYVEGKASLGGTWDAEMGISRDSADKDWSLKLGADRGAAGDVNADVAARWKADHGDYTSQASLDASTDGSLAATGGLAGADKDKPWSLDARVARTADDPELDWGLDGKISRTLDKDAGLTLSGEQSLGPDSARSRLELGYVPDDKTSASIWAERSYDNGESVHGLGGAYKTQIGGADAYARGQYRSDGSWEGAAGITKGTEDDDLSWFAEGHTGRDQFGKEDHGVRAGLKWRF
ncbi:MAG: hypothetical protein AB8H79_11760 [Myxococcota bacterium]